jgi:hypothetical protein
MYILIGYEYGYGCDKERILGLYESEDEVKAAEIRAKEHGTYLGIFWYCHEDNEY